MWALMSSPKNCVLERASHPGYNSIRAIRTFHFKEPPNLIVILPRPYEHYFSKGPLIPLILSGP